MRVLEYLHLEIFTRFSALRTKLRKKGAVGLTVRVEIRAGAGQQFILKRGNSYCLPY